MTTPAPTSSRNGGRAATAMTVSSVVKSYPGTNALADVNLEARQGEIHALLGGNGSGKSTLIKILAGVVAADAGTLSVGGRHIRLDRARPQESHASGLRFIHQDLGLFPSLTVAENLALGRGFPTGRGGRIQWRQAADDAAQSMGAVGLDVAPETPVSALGPAQRSMVAIARALHDHHDGGEVLVLDEPTAALRPADVELLFDTLRGRAARGGTVLLVTHQLSEALSVAQQITVLRDGHSLGTFEAAALDERCLVELITGGCLPERATDPRPSSGAVVLSVRNLTSATCSDVSFDLRAGEILGVAGLAGSGRSDLLRTLFGASPRTGGEVLLGGKPVKLPDPAAAIAQGVAYVPENRQEAVFADMSVRHNLSASCVTDYWRRLRLRHQAERADANASIRRYGIVTPSDETPVAWLSGGNQQKVVLARSLRASRRVYLLDEPTRGVDVGARRDIHDLIRDAVADGACTLVVSSDADELADLCDRVVVLAGGAIAAAVDRPLDARRLTEAIWHASNPSADE